MTEPLTPEHFLPHVEKVFRVKDDGHALTLMQVEVLYFKGVPRQAFSLIFSGPPGDVLREGLHTLQVERGPEFELYVMPIHTPVPGKQHYQAVFN
jgi:hypothetical protein